MWRLVPADGARRGAEVGGDAPSPPSLVWLGQAGFLLRLQSSHASGCLTVLIDPYLSDSLAAKYAGHTFTHERLVPPPFAPEAAPAVDLVLCTHGHTDHLDPETLGRLARCQPECRFLVPRAWRERALQSGITSDRMIEADSGDQLDVLPELRITALAAAHEDVELDEDGHSKHLGYVLDTNGFKVYHSGDCVPYPGLSEALAELDIAIALLPVNGRDRHRLELGVPGNFHPHEAIQLAAGMGADVLVGHHFGMFEFNTVNEADLRAALELLPTGTQWVRPRLGRRYSIGLV